MLFSTEKITILLYIIGLATAVPTKTNVRRSCQTAYPSLLVPIRSDFPDSFYGSHPSVIVSNNVTEPKSTLDTLLLFDGIAAGAYGCQLTLQFPDSSLVQSSGASQLSVYTVDRNVTLTDTWNSSPQKVNLWGSVNFEGTVPPSIVVNSETCEESLSFRLEIADLSQDGSISFGQTDGSGLEILYNC